MPGALNHKPVLLPELLMVLAIKINGTYVDATFGRGGHSQAILERLGDQGRLIAIDRDPEAIQYAKEKIHDKRFCIKRGAFSELEKIAHEENIVGKVDGIIVDLGVSSPQLDDAKRGFSFRLEGPLDMRMDPEKNISVTELLAHVKEEKLANILFEYGEERFSRRIAKAIITARNEAPITTTLRLAEIVAKANPAWERDKHPATRSFQALRIFVNDELDELKKLLKQSLDVLNIGGRLAVISFHSLEDRIVKEFIRCESQGSDIIKHLPIPDRQRNNKLRSLGKVIKPSAAEIDTNPRSRSAKLRIAERIK